MEIILYIGLMLSEKNELIVHRVYFYWPALLEPSKEAPGGFVEDLTTCHGVCCLLFSALTLYMSLQLLIPSFTQHRFLDFRTWGRGAQVKWCMIWWPLISQMIAQSCFCTDVALARFITICSDASSESTIRRQLSSMHFLKMDGNASENIWPSWGGNLGSR